VIRHLLVKTKHIADWRPARWWPVLAIGLTCLLLAFGGEDVRLWGRYDRTGLAEGEWWRLLTGHLVHLGWGHLWPNLAALALIAALLERTFRPRDWIVVGLASAVAIDAGLYALDPDVDWYVGLSGVLHGYLAGGSLLAMWNGDRIGALLAIGVAIKLVFEQKVGPVPFTASAVGGPVVVAAHLYGAAGGFAATAFSIGLRKALSRL